MIRFVDIVARTIPAIRLKEMSAAMLLNEEEEYLLLERCSKQKTVAQCDRIPPRRQSDIMASLNSKVEIWVLDEADKETDSFFSPRERQALIRAVGINRNIQDE